MADPRPSRFTRFFTRIGVLTTLLVLLAVGLSIYGWYRKGAVPEMTILELDLDQPIVEQPSRGPLPSLAFPEELILRDTLEALERGRDDARVKGLFARFGGHTHGMAVAQELRDAILAFRAKGKFAIAFAETFGEAESGNEPYYLATAFDEIWLQPSGDVGLTGLISEVPFARSATEKLGVAPRMDHRKEYKNALDSVTQTDFTEPHREALLKVLEDMFAQIARGIANGRKLTPEEVKRAADRGPFFATEAVDAKLVDRVGYRDQAIAHAKEVAGGGELVFADRYLEKVGRLHEDGPKIALIYGVGAVVRGESRSAPLFGGTMLGSETVAEAFRKAADDEEVKAIVFRIDSPGGSYVASDTIWRETSRAREAGKPIIVSMGNVAGSGGYFIAINATKIVAEPATITGSIGVIGGKVVTSDFWQKLGVHWGEVHTSENSTMFSSVRDFTPYGWERVQASLDRVYEDFTGKVAVGRNLAIERVQEIAKGRIWSGEAAKEIGLVDELGGFDVALRLAREAAGLAPDAAIEIEVFPEEKGFLEELLEEPRESSESEAAARAVIASLEELAPVARRIHGALAPPEAAGLLSMRVPEIGR